MNEFFQRLKQRKIVQWSLAYVAAAFGLLQGIDIIASRFGWPDAIERILIIASCIGFFVVLVLAWYHGERGAQRVSGTELLILALLLSLGGVFLWHFATASRAMPALSANPAPPGAIPEKSIAVLPFANEGGDKDQQYFSDGLSEDFIIALSQFAGLKVIGRNSSFQFRDSKDSSGTIGGKLGVAHLLEGSVRRAADVVRISAELVNATDGSTLWSQHYDRPYKDLFKVQDDITTAVASALKTRLLSADEAAARSDRPPSGSLEAYNAFLQAQFHRARGTKVELQEAIKFYQTAVSLDSHYALAYALMGNAQVFYGGYFSGAEAQKIFVMARTSIKTALSLNPDLAEAHTANALLLAFADLDWAGAKAEFERAVQLAPNDSDAVASLAQMNAAFGHPAAAIEPIRRTLADDPRNARWYALLSLDLMAVGRLDEAEQAIRQEIDVGGSEEGSTSRLCTIEVLRGNFAGALAKAEQLPPGKSRDFAIARARQIGNDRAAASAALQTLIAHYADTDAFHIAGVHALHGDPDDMFKWLDRAWANREDAVCVVYYDPFVLRYKTDPRFAAFCRKVGLPTPAEVASGSNS